MSFFPELVLCAARAGITALACLASTGCTHVPLTSLPALSRIDFSTTDLSAFRAAIRIPDAYVARGTRMIVDLKLDGAAPETFEFELDRLDQVAERVDIEQERRRGAQLIVYQLPEPAIARFEAVRARVAATRKEGRRGSLAIKLEPDFCYVVEPPRGSLPFSTFLKTSETGSFVAVLRDFDAMAQKDYAEQIRKMPKC